MGDGVCRGHSFVHWTSKTRQFDQQDKGQFDQQDKGLTSKRDPDPNQLLFFFFLIPNVSLKDPV